MIMMCCLLRLVHMQLHRILWYRVCKAVLCWLMAAG